MPYLAKQKKVKKRRVPVQKRSIERVNKILDTAAELMQGSEKLSTHLIAQHANISVGSVYQFFPDIESVKTALIERLMDGLYDQIFKVLEDPETHQDLNDLRTYMVHVVYDFYASSPDIARIIVSMRFTEEFYRANQRLNDRLTELLVDFYLRKGSPFPEKELRRQARMSMEIGDTMTMLIWTAKTLEERELYLEDWLRLEDFRNH